MTTSPPPRRPPYWLLPVFAVLLLAPPAWATALAVGAAVAAIAVRGGRRALARRAHAASAPAPGEATRLGVDRAGHEVLLSERELSAHGLILGASGAGKSTTLLAILTDHIRRGRPVVAIDLKGSPSFRRELQAAARAAGRPFRVWTPDGPDSWNPLAHGNATQLKDKLIATERFTEPHYQRAAERYVQSAVQVLHEVHPERAATLDEVVSVMDPRRLAVLVRDLPKARREQVHDYLAGLTPDQLSAIRGLGTRLAIITESRAGQFLSPGTGDPGLTRGQPATIDLRAALEGDQVVLFSLNSSSYGKLAAQLGTLVVQDLTTAVGDRLERSGADAPLQPAFVGIDEFSALGADNVLALLARGRESGVSVFLATQELADLDRAAQGLRDQVMGNAAVKIAHRQDVPGSAQTIAQLAGTVKVWDESRQIGGRLFGGIDTGRGTRRQVEQFRVHPNQIKTLRTGDAVVITKLPHTKVRTVRVTPPRREPSARQGPELG